VTDKAGVLIVDDDIEMTETLSDILEDLGYHVEVANDGLKAIKKFKARAFDVILMDIKMPGINGVETYKEIKNIQPKAAVMMMTAYSVEDLVAEALKEGAYGIMYKPIDIAKVVEFIERVKKSVLILIVDDDLSTCEILMRVLEEKGYHIARASSGEEAIKMVREVRFGIVFIDIKMPVMNGLEIYLALRKIRPDIKAIMMTGYRQEVQDLVEEAIKNNAYTCLYKPFDVKKVLKLLEGILARKSKAQINHMEVN
jgi:two-component system response regulator HydG